MDAKFEIYDTFYKSRYSYFRQFRACLASKLAESANMTQNKFSRNISIWVSNQPEFDADFESIKNIEEKNSESLLLSSVLKDENNIFLFL
jgi:hypothetical protein